MDNAAYSFAFQMENGSRYCIAFYDFKADKELINLKEYLIEMAIAEEIGK